jgi:type IX secretion system PorP/SprF family membrane protein
MNAAHHHSVRVAFALVLMCASLNLCAQQTPHFTQYMFNPLILNPAVAGADDILSAAVSSRQQWNGVKGAPETQTLTVHTLVVPSRLGLGVSAMTDEIGIHRTQQFHANASYRMRVSRETYLSMGMRAGLRHQKSDYASLNVTDPDPKLSGTQIAQNHFSIGAGVFLRNKRLEAGLSVPQLLPLTFDVNDTVSVRMRTTDYLLFGRYSFPIHPYVDFQPGVLVKFQHGAPLSYDVNAGILIQKVLFTGISYRKKESVDFLLRANITAQLVVGYSYDHAIGRVGTLARNGSHELMVNYLFRFSKSKTVSPR